MQTENQNPTTTLKETVHNFFLVFDKEEVKTILWNMYSVAIISELMEDQSERSDITFLYGNLQELVAALHQFDQA